MERRKSGSIRSLAATRRAVISFGPTKSFQASYRLDWEDLHLGPTGDFNDYMAYVEMRSCSDEPGKPLYSLPNPEVQRADCWDNCFRQNVTCDATSATADLNFSVSLSLDAQTGGEREKRGRLMFVTVATYDSKPRHTLAVCPTVVFNARANYKFTTVTHGVDQKPPYVTIADKCNRAASVDGNPRCGEELVLPGFWAVSLAREQHYKPWCGTYTGTGDTFATPAKLTCGNAAPHFETYEVSLRDIDAWLDPADQLSGLRNADIIAALHSVKLNVYETFGVAKFHCGSGVNITRYTSNPNVATMSSQSLVKGSSSFNLGTIDRQ